MEKISTALSYVSPRAWYHWYYEEPEEPEEVQAESQRFDVVIERREDESFGLSLNGNARAL